MLVYILDKDNKPLMPCSPRVAKLLLRNGKATVAQRTPFTIKLLFGSSGYKQDVTLGVDAGSKTIGLSATLVPSSNGRTAELKNGRTERLRLVNKGFYKPPHLCRGY